MKIGLKIKQLAKEKRISATEIADFLGKTRQYVYNLYEKDKIDMDTLRQLSTFFKVSYSYFIDGFVNESQNIDKETTQKSQDYQDILIDTLQNEVSSLREQNAFMQQQLQFLQNLVQNQMGELKTLLMTREMSSSVGKWGEIEDSQPAFTVLKGEGTAKIVPLTPLFKVS